VPSTPLARAMAWVLLLGGLLCWTWLFGLTIVGTLWWPKNRPVSKASGHYHWEAHFITT
jgi:hypothetical protein